MVTAANPAVSFPDDVHIVDMRSNRHRRVSPPSRAATDPGLIPLTIVEIKKLFNLATRVWRSADH